jgi:hypothetical protein
MADPMARVEQTGTLDDHHGIVQEPRGVHVAEEPSAGSEDDPGHVHRDLVDESGPEQLCAATLPADGRRSGRHAATTRPTVTP